MPTNELYPALEHYIYHYCSAFKTPLELEAEKTALNMAQTEGHDKMRKAMINRGWISEAPEVLEMLKEGSEVFIKRMVERIWAAHQHELPLNLCPKCNKIAKTPKARQCQFCYHDWH